MTELISLLNELKTLEAIAKATGVVPVQVTNAIDAVVAVLSKVELVKPDTVANVLADVRALLDAVDELEANDDVKTFAKQVITLVENIVKVQAKPVAPAAPVASASSVSTSA